MLDVHKVSDPTSRSSAEVPMHTPSTLRSTPERISEYRMSPSTPPGGLRSRAQLATPYGASEAPLELTTPVSSHSLSISSQTGTLIADTNMKYEPDIWEEITHGTHEAWEAEKPLLELFFSSLLSALSSVLSVLRSVRSSSAFYLYL